MEVNRLLGDLRLTLTKCAAHLLHQPARSQRGSIASRDQKLLLHVQWSVRLAAQVRKCGWPALLPPQICTAYQNAPALSLSNPQITRHLVLRGPVVAADLSETDVGKPPQASTMAYAMWLKGLAILATGVISEAAFAPAPAPAGELSCLSASARSLWPGTP